MPIATNNVFIDMESVSLLTVVELPGLNSWQRRSHTYSKLRKYPMRVEKRLSMLPVCYHIHNCKQLPKLWL